jgi:protease-4
LGSVDSVAREVFKLENVKDYSRSENVAERLAKRFGAGVTGGAVQALQRFGVN